jgi:hypothetical protein
MSAIFQTIEQQEVKGDGLTFGTGNLRSFATVENLLVWFFDVVDLLGDLA